MTNEQIIDLLKKISPKMHGEVGKESFSQVFFDLQKDYPALLKKIEENADDLIMFVIGSISGIFDSLGIVDINDRLNLENQIMNVSWDKFLQKAKSDPGGAILSVNDLLRKKEISFQINSMILKDFCEAIAKIRKMEQTVRVIKMLEKQERIMACFGYVPRYLSMNITDINSEFHMLDDCFIQSEMVLFELNQSRKICIDALTKSGHPKDSLATKELGQIFEILSAQYLACRAVQAVKLHQTQSDSETTIRLNDKNAVLDFIANVIINIDDYRNSAQ